jgi:hypothetical protein
MTIPDLLDDITEEDLESMFLEEDKELLDDLPTEEDDDIVSLLNTEL